MRGSMLKTILDEQNVSISELARRLDVSPQTLYSMVKRDSQKVDFDLMLRICRELGVPVERFCDDGEMPGMPDDREWSLVRSYRNLDDHGRELADLVLDAELRRIDSAEAESDIKAQRTGRNCLDIHIGSGITELHNGTFSISFFDLCESRVKGF